MNLQSIFGSVAIGKDSSGNFKQSVYGIAAKTGDNKFISRQVITKKNGKKKDTGGHGRDSGGGETEEKILSGFMDVSDLTIEGTESLFYRIPVKIKELVPHQDLIILSDDPFSVLFVEGVNGDVISGYDPSTGKWPDYTPVGNLLNLKFVVRVTGPGQLLDGMDNADLLPFLMAGNSAGGTGLSGNDPLSTLLLIKAIGGDAADKDKLLSTLLLLGNSGSVAGAGNNALLTMLLLKGKDLF